MPTFLGLSYFKLEYITGYLNIRTGNIHTHKDGKHPSVCLVFWFQSSRRRRKWQI